MPAKEYASKPYYAKSSANDRMVRGYPSPKYFDLMRNFMDANEMNMSESVGFILKDFFDKMGAEDIARIRELAEQKRVDPEKKIA